MSGFKKIECLGRGAFGEAWLVEDEKTKEKLVLKQARVNASSERNVQTILNELHVLTGVRHANVVQFCQHTKVDPDTFAILMEYCPLGDLGKKIKENATIPRHFPDDVIIRWLRHLANGLDHIHSLNIVHGDLKPDNIFLAENSSLKIGDFGIAQFVPSLSAIAADGFIAGSLYTAPEVFQDQDHSSRCDLWSLGVILYELITLRRPFKKSEEVMTGTYDLLPSTVHEDLCSIVADLLQMDPKQRPRCNILLEKDILQGEATVILSKKPYAVPPNNPFASAFGVMPRGSSATATPAAPTELDLAFVIDCTGSMQSYINATKEGLKQIVEEIKKTEKCNVRLALIEYRDHPPQDTSFVTNVHPFTEDENAVRNALDGCVADGGGDAPEAIADALHELSSLNWRKTAAKVVVMVVDAPPHGLKGFSVNDGFPNGCPCGHDPVSLCAALSEDVVLYFVGCEPNSRQFRDVYDALAFKTGGRYVPLTEASKLTKLIIASSRAGLSYTSFTKTVAALTLKAVKEAGGNVPDEQTIAESVCKKVKESGSTLSVVSTGTQQLPPLSENAKLFKTCKDLSALNAMISERKSVPTDARDSGDGEADYRVETAEPSVDLVRDLAKKSYRKLQSDDK